MKSFPWNGYPIREIFLKTVREKYYPIREIFLKSARENYRLSVKFYQKLCVKNRFLPWKKSKKSKKRVSRITFFFTHKKKHCIAQHGYSKARARLGTARARLAWAFIFPKEIHLIFFILNWNLISFSKRNQRKFLVKSLFIFSKRNQRKFFKIDTFGKFFQKSCESCVFDFCWSGPQLVQNIKPIRQLLCTFSSSSVLGIYLINNIYI